ncbi:endolytic transglycosylase MltG [Candidatus Dojkabacteria bacterium]|nr:endolytic transglycosylase MltG [Candidatus Dojkabacteria bacterium]
MYKRNKKQSFRKDRKQKAKRINKLKKMLPILFLVPIVLVLFLFGSYKYLFFISSSNNNVKIEVEEGDSRYEIAEKLEEKGIIKSSDLFILYTKITKKGGDIKAGIHTINGSMSISDIIIKLEQIPEEDVIWIDAFPEGIRYDEIANYLEKGFASVTERNFSKQEFLNMCEDPWAYKGMGTEGILFVTKYVPEGNSAEGFLFPAKYDFYKDAETWEVFDRLVLTLKQRLEEENLLQEIEKSNLSLYEVLNIASMLEREGFTEKEYKMISDILQRRLQIGMHLGVDATSLYQLKDWEAELTYQELEDENPYNTRKNLGLPPTPISNPGIVTIKAVLNPTANEYLYYLHDSEGEIHYAKTNAEHEKNKSK